MILLVLGFFTFVRLICPCSTVDVTVERQGEEQSFTLVRRFVSRRVHSGDAPEQATAGVHAA